MQTRPYVPPRPVACRDCGTPHDLTWLTSLWAYLCAECALGQGRN